MSRFRQDKMSHFLHVKRLQPGLLPRSSLALLLLHRDTEHPRLALGLEPVALALDVDRCRVVQQTVQDRRRQYRIAEDVTPVHEALVACQRADSKGQNVGCCCTDTRVRGAIAKANTNRLKTASPGQRNAALTTWLLKSLQLAAVWLVSTV